MKLKELLKELDIIEIKADTELDISDICYDSRKAKKGSLFVAITGFERDGHDYISAAVLNGAAAVLCEKRPEIDIPYILLDGTRHALAIASANFYGHPANEVNVIGVTGTNGKTTTTTLIKCMIEGCTDSKVGLIGTNQNMVGEEVLEAERTTPESSDLQKLFREMVDKGCKWVVMEVSSHSLALDRVDGIRFHTGVFTNLTQDHLDFHITMEEYAQAKAMLFSRCDRAVVNIDDSFGEFFAGKAACPVLTYSDSRNEAGLVAKNIRLRSNKVEFSALTMDELHRVELHIPGEFSVYNALATIGVGLGMGLKLSDLAEVLSNCSGVKGRVEVVPAGEDYTVIIDYAHTPDAIENVLNAARSFAEGRVVILFGCGGDRDKTKRPLMGEIATNLADYVIVTSDNPRTEVPGDIIKDILAGMKDTKTPYSVIENRREAIHFALDNALPGDVIILAGKGHETYQIIGKEKIHMDEREIVADYFKK